MGHTIWVDVRDRPKDQDDREDCSIMLRLEAHLDGLCQALNVRKLSDFYDYSELERAYADFDEESESTPDSAPLDSDQPPGAWYDAGQALAAVRALREHFVHDPNDLGFEPDRSRQHWPERLMEELKHCETLLEKAVSGGRQFRFLIVP
jgi:hypothetical protein